jgi:hypothetical protein
MPDLNQMPPQDGTPLVERDEMTEDELAQEKLGDVALLSGPEFQDWEWHIKRLRTRDEINADPNGGVREIMERRVGPLDLFELQERLGGGTFELWGFYDNGNGQGKRLRRKPIVTFAGPRKRFDVPLVVTPAPTTASGDNTALARFLERMEYRLDRLERTAAPAAPAPTSIKELAETLVLLNGLQAKPLAPPPNPDREVVNGLMQMVKTGIEIGQGRDPVPAGEGNGTDWGKVIETAAPIVDRILSRYTPVQRPPLRKPGAPPPPAPTPPASSAAIVDEPEREVAAVVNHRWPTAIESLANAIADGEDPIDFTITLERILNKQEFAMLRAASVDQVMGELAGVLDTYPILKTEPARVFLDALLSEIRNPSEIDPVAE